MASFKGLNILFRCANFASVLGDSSRNVDVEVDTSEAEGTHSPCDRDAGADDGRARLLTDPTERAAGLEGVPAQRVVCTSQSVVEGSIVGGAPVDKGDEVSDRGSADGVGDGDDA